MLKTQKSNYGIQTQYARCCKITLYDKYTQQSALSMARAIAERPNVHADSLPFLLPSRLQPSHC